MSEPQLTYLTSALEDDVLLLTITHKQGQSKTESIAVLLADEMKRDELLQALTAQLGPEWERQEKQISRLRSAAWPLGLTAVAVFLTWFMYDEAEQIAAGRQLKPAGGRANAKLISTILHWVEGLIGSIGVLILGGLLAALCVVWLVYAVANPVIHITVQPRSQR